MTRSKLFSSLLVIAALSVSADTAAAQNPACSSLAGNLVLNCSFEDPAYGSGSVSELPATITNWQSSGAFERWTNAFPFGQFPSREGNAHLELDSHGNTTIWQYISTVVGQNYQVYFSAGHRNYQQQGSQVGVTIDDDELQLISTPLMTSTDPGQFVWVDYVVNFTATNTSTKLSFLALGPSDSYGDHLDNISMVATSTVPEPNTYALMGAGLVAMAIVARRRRAL